MEQDYFPSLSLLTRLHSPSWQQQLRQSVRLYLALGAEAPATAELERLLHGTEQEMLDYLLAGEPAIPAARRQAQVFLDMAQHDLLASEPAVQALLEELIAA